MFLVIKNAVFLRFVAFRKRLFEGIIWEELQECHGISTMSILNAAIEQGSDILTLTKDNFETQKDTISVSGVVFKDISDAIASGKTVIIPKKEVTIGNWSGIGYIVLNPETGAAAYMISGGLHGGATDVFVGLAGGGATVIQCCWLATLIVDLIELLACPPSVIMLTNPIAQAIVAGIMIGIFLAFSISTILSIMDLLDDLAAYYQGDKSKEDVILKKAKTTAIWAVFGLILSKIGGKIKESESTEGTNGGGVREHGNEIGKEGGTDTTRVGRWMSQEEYEKMISTGMVQMSGDNKVHVANPADINAFGKQAPNGSLYVKFDVPSNTISKGGTDGWGIINGPGSLLDRLNAKKGLPRITEMPNATNITIGGKK